MKKIYYIIFLSIVIISSSCKDLLDKKPLDQISEPAFWKTANDLQLYLNTFYSTFPGWEALGSGGANMKDNGTDNSIPGNLWLSTKDRFNGVLTVPSSGGGWDWTNVRNVNYFLANAKNVAPGNLVGQYIGEGYFFRAWFYYQLLTKFGNLPIITKPVNVSDVDILYGSRSTRTQVVNFIISDLDSAITKMGKPSAVPASRLNTDVASQFKARVCLYEGTWEKYHKGDPFAGETDGTVFLQKAATAAKVVMDAGDYSLVQGNKSNVYYNLFNQIDYSKNSEVLLWKQFDFNTYGQNYGGIFGNQLWNWPNNSGITREMIRSYLCSDGLPISASPLYQGDLDLRQVTVNRDPRCVQSIMTPRDVVTVDLKNDTTFFTLPQISVFGEPTGYEFQKFRRPQFDPVTGTYSQSVGFIIFRYAEALLIYAEAKAESGQLTQADVDLTINKLRQRVGMPSMVLSSITSDPDWPDYGYSLPDYLYEIRRERNVELFSEGFRLDDLMRWAAHKLFVGKRPLGTFYTNEIKLQNPALNTDANGYIDLYKGVLSGPNGGWGFKPGRDYLLAIPSNELTLNKNLTQNPGW